MKNKIRVVIADDHDLFLAGLEGYINSAADMQVVASASNGKKLVELVRTHQPDVVVTDIRMPVMDGIQAITAIGKLNGDSRILVLSTFDNNYLVVDALDAGAMGYILKDAPKTEVIDAVRTIYDNEPYYCSQTTTKLAKLINRSRFNPYPPLNSELFSTLEKKIIHYICEEKTSEEMSRLLFIGRRSIENYRRTILTKMKVKTPIGVVIYAVKNNLYPAVPDALLSR